METIILPTKYLHDIQIDENDIKNEERTTKF